jgi:hypothetical protein
MENSELIYPNSMREAAELDYEVVGSDCLMAQAQFVSDNEMDWEGEFEMGVYFDSEEDKSDGNLGTIRVRAKAHYTFEVIEPAK